MNRKIIIPFLFIVSLWAVKSGGLAADETRRVFIAVPDFIIDEGIPEPSAASLAEVLQTEFIGSGKIAVKGRTDIAAAIEAVKSPLEEESFDCLSDDACVQKLGQRLGADYIAHSSASRISGAFLIQIRLRKTSSRTEIPIIIKRAETAEGIADAVRSAGANIALRLPLEGSILAVVQNGRNVILDLGSVCNLKEGDEFFVMRETVIEGFRDRRRVGTVKIIEAQEQRSKAEVKDGRGDIQKGDFVVQNNEELLKKLENERFEDEAKLAEMSAIEEQRKRDREVIKRSEEERRSTVLSFAAKASFIRIGYGGFGLVRFGEDYLNEYYPKGYGILGDVFFYRIRGRKSGNGFDFYSRYCYRQFTMTDDSYDDFKSDHAAAEYGKARFDIHSLDLGGRLIFGGYLLFSRIDFYLIGAVRQSRVVESADNGLKNTYMPTGMVGGGGIEIALFRSIAIFGEYNIGYSVVGANKDNIDGHQVFFGLALRTGHL